MRKYIKYLYLVGVFANLLAATNSDGNVLLWGAHFSVALLLCLLFVMEFQIGDKND